VIQQKYSVIRLYGKYVKSFVKALFVIGLQINRVNATINAIKD